MENLIESELKEAQLLLDAHDHCVDESRAELILSLVKEIISPYLAARHPRALWLESNLIGQSDESGMSDEEFDDLWLRLVKESSDGGCPEAQYDYGCYLYERGECEKAVDLYRLSAQEGYRCSQWCLGLDSLNGVGVEKNEKVGLHYIRLSAEQQYGLAIEFMIESCRQGKYGLAMEEIKKWELILMQSEPVS